MLIIRHNRLKPPYHDYASMTAPELDLLASGKVSPDIAELPQAVAREAEIRKAMQDADYFVCSQASRTQQTCAALMQRFGLQKDIRVDACLNEITFVPSKLMVDKDENPLYAARTRLYSTMAAGGEGTEEAAAVEQRINGIFKNYQTENAVLFSHGFLMRLMMAGQAANNFTQALSCALKVPHVDYLNIIHIKNT